MASLINGLINILKYPIAILMSILTYKLAIILMDLVIYILKYHHFYRYLIYGFDIYIVLWLFIFSRKEGDWFLTLEHELTHTIFAILTFHGILKLEVTKHQGGLVQFDKSTGNWLVYIAPYFFPTFSMIIIILIYISNSQYYPILTTILGYSIMYHIHSTIKETKPYQPDLQAVGFPFAIMFLPGANLLALIWVLSAIPDDKIYFSHILSYLYDYLNYLYEYVKYL